MNNPFIERQNQLKRNILGGFTGILVASDEVQKAEDTEIEKAKHTPGETKNVNGKTYVWTEYKPGKFDWQVQKKKETTKHESSLGIKGEPKKGVIARDKEEGTSLKYDPNTQTITFYEGKEKYDSLDCSHFKNWSEVEKELKEEYGWDISKKQSSALDKLSHDDPEAYEAVAGAGKESLKWLESQANSKDKIYAAAVKQRINEIKNDK